ncbi:MAG: class GN sortase, partial [Gammaproteobacteria bacterium]
MGLRVLLAVLALGGAVGNGGEAAWIYAKAVLAQHLLERSWSRATTEGENSRPWPWADTWPVARINIPRLGVSRIVLAGASGEALAFGPGLVDGSSVPGATGNSIIAGHRDTQFGFLVHLQKGDLVEVELPDGPIAQFHVSSFQVLDSRTTSLVLDSDEPLLTFVSCYPFEARDPGGPLRYV